ncbi:MAG: BatA domain-containing protein [Planctomycetes bacterium]|nr:BatA domain-containing protein [Planctomycetota bacterium]
MFLNPWAVVAGMVAAGLPLAIHLLTRPRPVRMPLSTLRFVREAIRQRRARHRLRDMLVLALRTLAVLLLAGAVARPLVGTQRSAAAPEENVERVRVVILDVSQSMAARERGVEVFERARPLAADELAYQPGLKANLILAAAQPVALFAEPSTNFAALREELAGAHPRPERSNVPAALTAAAEMLDRGDRPGVRRELVIVSDFQRSDWAAADFSLLPADITIRLESVAPHEAPPNLAIVRAGTRGPVEAGRDARLHVDIGNFSATPRQVRVEARLNEAVLQLTGNCPARATTTLTGSLVLQEAGWHAGEVRLRGQDDALPADDVRPLVVHVRRAPVYGLMTRQSPERRPSSSYYLERALVPEEQPRGEDSQIVRLEPEDPDRELLGLVDLVVVDHPGQLPDATVQQLNTLLRRGRGMLYVAAEAADAVNLERLQQAAGDGQAWPVEFSPAGSNRRDLFLVDVRGELPPFRVFGDELTAAVAPLRFAGGLVTRPVAGALAEDVLASFNDRTAFLVAASAGRGSLVVMNADLAASNLPQSPIFVPLLGELVERLSSGESETVEVSSGEPLTIALPASSGAADGLAITGPAGTSDAGSDLVAEPAGVLWHAAAAGAPGVYRVERDGRTEFAVASAIPATESDLAPLPANVFRERLSAGRDLRFRSQSSLNRDARDRLWTWLAVACASCLLAEVATLRMFRM